jgi:arginine/lysine/ornithine decarboxylase
MKTFKKLYILNPDDVSKSIMNTLVMCGSTNWDYYFEETNNNNSEFVENISLIEFKNKEHMLDFIKDNKNAIVDYSIEHKKPSVLIQN